MSNKDHQRFWGEAAMNPDEQYMLRQYRAGQAPGHPKPASANAWGEMLAWLARIDWHKVFIWATRLIVVACFLYAGYKLVNIWQTYPGVEFLPFLDMHTPLMLFSGLFTFNYIQHRDSEGVGIIALLSTMLNALLV